MVEVHIFKGNENLSEVEAEIRKELAEDGKPQETIDKVVLSFYCEFHSFDCKECNYCEQREMVSKSGNKVMLPMKNGKVTVPDVSQFLARNGEYAAEYLLALNLYTREIEEKDPMSARFLYGWTTFAKGMVEEMARAATDMNFQKFKEMCSKKMESN